MPRIQPLLPFLRPLSAPRTPANSQFLRFTTGRRLRVDTPATPISEASTNASKAAPPPPSSPQAASRVADLAAAEAAIEADNPNPPSPKPVLPSDHTKPSRPARSNNAKAPKPKEPAPASPPKYLVSRSKNNNYPIYTDYKRGGNLHITTVRKITGDLGALSDELRSFLDVKEEDVRVNVLTKHVIVKGHHTSRITDFLKAKGM